MKQTDIDIADAIMRTVVVESLDDELKQLEEDKTPVSFSDAHEKRMRRLFARARAKRAAVRVWAITRKTATAAAFLVAVLSVFLLFNPMVQAAVSEVITEFFAQFTSFRFNNSSEEPIGDVEWVIGWLPESYSEIYKEYDYGISRAGYTNPDGATIRFTANPAENNQINVDNENADYSVRMKDGVEYHIFDSLSGEIPSTIIWVSQGYDFLISAYCDTDTLEQIAFSIQRSGR